MAFFIQKCILYIVLVCVGQTSSMCDVCSCATSENNQTLAINCNGKGIQNNQIYEYVKSVSNLSDLHLQFNNLQELQTFPVSKLRFLDLGHNSIRSLDKGVFANLQGMEELILSHNSIELIDPDAFRGVYSEHEFYPLKGLRVLNLSYNNLTSLNADVFEHIDELENLILSGNPFKSIDASTVTAIASLVNLKSLNLSGMQLQELPKDFTSSTQRSLKELDLSGNNFGSIPIVLGELQVLETLNIDDNPIRNISLERGFPHIPTLSVLHLSNMSQLEELGAYSLSALENLKELYLASNKRLSRISADFLARSQNGTRKWPPLTKVLMSRNNITHLSNLSIPNWRDIDVLDLSENPWRCDCEIKWLIEELEPARKGVSNKALRNMRCMFPLELRNTLLYDLHIEKDQMRSSPTPSLFLLFLTVSGIVGSVACILFIAYFWPHRKLRQTMFEMRFREPLYRQL